MIICWLLNVWTKFIFVKTKNNGKVIFFELIERKEEKNEFNLNIYIYISYLDKELNKKKLIIESILSSLFGSITVLVK